MAMHRGSVIEAAVGIGNGVRFLNFSALWIKTQIFGMNSVPYFWISILHHIIVTLIVFQSVRFWSQRHFVAFLSALLFATTFSHYEVITSISASDYSLWAIFYTTTLLLFAVYLRHHTVALYLASIGAYAILVFAHDFTLSIPLILLAYHLTLGLDLRKISSFGWRDLKLHLPFWALWGIHVSIQLTFVLLGSSEAVYSEEAYRPGFHMVRNLFYLVFLIVPNVYIAQIYNFLVSVVSIHLIELFWILTIVLAIVSHLLAGIYFWKGTSLTRFALALIYLPFLQYTLWEGSFAGATRYLYLPSIGFSILLAILWVNLYDYLNSKEWFIYRWGVPVLVSVFLIANLVIIQVWVQQHIDNSKIRRPFVTQLEAKLQNIEPNAVIFIEVPTKKFTDLGGSCRLALEQTVDCFAYVSGDIQAEEQLLNKLANTPAETPIYWLLATANDLQVNDSVAIDMNRANHKEQK